MNHYNTIGIDSQLDWPRIRKLFCIGLFAACLVLEGDMLLGWSVADENAAVFGTFSKYIGLSEQRVFWSAFLGLVGIPLEILCYFGIYRLIADNFLMILGVVVLSVWDGFRSGFTFSQFFLRFVLIFTIYKLYDMVCFDYFLLIKFKFFQYYYPEVESVYRGRKYGFNIKSQLIKLLVIFPAVSALAAWICTLF